MKPVFADRRCGSRWAHRSITYLLTYLLTYSKVQSHSWEANWFAASQEIPRISRNPKVHYRTHKPPPHVSILGQPNPVHKTSLFVCCKMFPLETLPPRGDPSGGVVYLRIVLPPEQASRMWVFLNINVLQGGFVSTSPNPQAGGPPLDGCPRMLIQYIRSYPPYRRPFLYPQPEDAPCRGDRTHYIVPYNNIPITIVLYVNFKSKRR